MSDISTTDSGNSAQHSGPHFSHVIVVMGIAIAAGVICQQWMFGKTDRSFTGHYRLETYSVLMPSEGTIQQWQHKSGMSITVDDELVTVADQSVAEQQLAIEQELELLDQKISTLEAKAQVELARLVRGLDEEQFEVESHLATYHQQKYDHELKVVALNDLLQESPRVASRENSIDFFSQPRPDTADSEAEKIKIQLEQQTAQNAVESCDVLIEMCSARLNDLKLKKADLSKQSRDALGLQELKIRERQLKQHLEQLKQKSKAMTLKAPGTGMLVIPVGMVPGKVLEAEAEVAQIVDHDQAYLLIQVPSSKISWLAENTEVVVHFSDDLTAQGVVDSIADRAISVEGQEETVVPVKIRPFGKAWPKLPLNASVRVTLD